ncbi:hypothetical protein CDAR_547871 [Caerostris darwini]|uniref:Uncharacterized protein n=1 Tax=Caerostris darwini TaxID=1538125 RepID=A0AAV4WEE4_9ARAC|nr:hypothetical protein CDAR_547871 [Caerostris darwini]
MSVTSTFTLLTRRLDERGKKSRQIPRSQSLQLIFMAIKITACQGIQTKSRKCEAIDIASNDYQWERRGAIINNPRMPVREEGFAIHVGANPSQIINSGD